MKARWVSVVIAVVALSAGLWAFSAPAQSKPDRARGADKSRSAAGKSAQRASWALPAYGFNDAYATHLTGTLSRARSAAIAGELGAKARLDQLGAAANNYVAAVGARQNLQTRVSQLASKLKKTPAEKRRLQTLRSQLTYARAIETTRHSQMTQAQSQYQAARAQADQAQTYWKGAWSTELARIDRIVRLTKLGGGNTARFIVPWDAVQPTRSNTWDFWYYDELISRLHSAGIRPIIILNSSPCWAHPSVPCSKLGAPYASIRPDAAFLDEFQTYAAKVAQRYPGARGIEIWNEPNSTHFWGPGASAGAYLKVLRAGYHGVKSASPATPVISAGPSPLTKAPWSRWMTKLYAQGADQVSDVTGLHPYSTSSSLLGSSLKQVDQTREILRARGSANQIWVTEVGVSTNPGVAKSFRATPSQQAGYLVGLARGLRDRRVPVMVVHRLEEIRHANAWENGLAVRKIDGSPKPAFCAMSSAYGVDAAAAGC